MPKIVLKVGDKFGKLEVIGFPYPRLQNYKCLCRCDCGVEKLVYHNHLGVQTTSCGCSRQSQEFKAKIASIKTTHGMSKTKIHQVWEAIKQRCLNPNNKAYPNYGGRGITICKRWLKFENFLADMGDPPNRGNGKGQLTIDRKNNDKGYSKGNCRWATRSEQTKNQRPRRKHADQS